MTGKPFHKPWYILLLILFLSAFGDLRAGQDDYADGKDYSKEVPVVETSWCETPSLWAVRVGLPGWLAGISGDSGVKGLEASSDVKFTQVLRHLTHVPIALSINARYGRWEFWADGQYIEDTNALSGPFFTGRSKFLGKRAFVAPELSRFFAMKCLR